ncbi:hypothetical protein DIT71_14845 [Marinobacter vulgaris]|uniref:Catalase n=1 Tax=Marinobacter vulgaris TaxID=1928331 RepID=A0A2V3ZWF2_9GAMM|nr:putative metalloprotease CJM1_0395 family protein [Marinobacter vulgaris]PXX89782.1 hypothetical protein DIT71_14845 [Marinobacter vulgaris]TSJ68774.1 hypothetical protein FPC41_14835 [Marinobacter vulgaris]
MMIPGSLPSVAPVYPLPGVGAADPARQTGSEPASADSERAPTIRTISDDRNAGDGARPQRSGSDNASGLQEAELQELSDLKARDREVRAHETAHQAAGGQYAGSISYVYERGPDGAQYAVGGEVSIDTSPVQGDPQATIEKMRVVRAAALAPAEPSPQDRAVAAEAMQLMLQAQSELSSELGGQKDVASPGGGDGSDQANRESRNAASAYQTVADFNENSAVNEVTNSRFMATA